MKSNEMAEQDNHLIWLDNSRILAIFGVILFHVSFGIMLYFPIGSSGWWVSSVYDTIRRWCIPVFVMITGALLLDQEKKESPRIFYKKRFSKITIPLIFWTAFYIFINMRFEGQYSQDLMNTIKMIIKEVLTGDPYYHMWYLYMLVGLYLVIPFLRKIASNSTEKELILLVVFSFIVVGLVSAYKGLILHTYSLGFFITQFLPFIPYFFAGHIIRTTRINPTRMMLWFIFLFSIILTCMGRYFTAIRYDLAEGLYFPDYFSITVIPMSISVMFLLKTWNQPIINSRITKSISSLTMGIYVIHPALLLVVNFLFYFIYYLSPTFSIPLITILVFLFSMTATWLFSRVPVLKRII